MVYCIWTYFTSLVHGIFCVIHDGVVVAPLPPMMQRKGDAILYTSLGQMDAL